MSLIYSNSYLNALISRCDTLGLYRPTTSNPLNDDVMNWFMANTSFNDILPEDYNDDLLRTN